jgi:hypothetical protein
MGAKALSGQTGSAVATLGGRSHVLARRLSHDPEHHGVACRPAASRGWLRRRRAVRRNRHRVREPVFKVMNLCVFADGSAIDEFGIMYYAAGTVRGADLAPLSRYQPGDKLPAMVAEPRR